MAKKPKPKVPAWERAIEKALKKPRPEGGWPKPAPRPRGRPKKSADPLDAILRRELKKGPPGPYLPPNK